MTGSATPTACTYCAPGFVRPYGTQACAKCAAGSYQPEPLQRCVDCSPGYYSPFEGSIMCFPCALGTHSPSDGAASCTACPVGTFAASAGASVCTACPAGGYCATAGASSAAMTFEQCDAGFIILFGQSASARAYRAYRKANPVPRLNQHELHRLPAGSYSASGAAQCTRCSVARTDLARRHAVHLRYLCVEGCLHRAGRRHARNQTVLTEVGFLGSLDDCVLCGPQSGTQHSSKRGSTLTLAPLLPSLHRSWHILPRRLR